MENNGNAILEGLNAEQRQAVECVEGAVLIVAGAGSGKTRVLTSRIARILEGGADPSRILALTFTKKAAGEMKERIALMVGKSKAWRISMGTFHSVFIRLLREYSDSLGYPSSFTVYDTSDSVSAMKACIKELGLDDKTYKPKDVLSRISLAKNNLVTAAAYRNNPKIIEKDVHSKRPRICDLFSLYTEKCKKAGVMDFDDILLNMNILLRDYPQARQSIASRFDYILVDEYQDTNYAQYRILRSLSEGKGNICVVGDDSQSIYAFRGAKIENILNFQKDFPGCRMFRLEKNYRSTSNIVDAANSLIAKNANRIPKTCVAVGGEGEKIRLLKNFTEQEEAVSVASEIISRMQSDHAKYQDFAVLYRTNSQSRAIEEALRKRSLPYMIYSGNSFFERAEVKTMMAYFKLVVNVHDDESFKRAVNEPARGIGATSLEALAAMARDLGVSLFRAAYSEKFADYGLKQAAVSRIRAFCGMIDGFASRENTTDASELAKSLSDACGLHAHFKSDSSIESQARASNVEELVNSVALLVEDRQNEYLEELRIDNPDLDDSEVAFPIVTLGEFLENVSLLSNVDIQDDEDTNNKIALMTAHSAKGLEFPYVFVVGMEENLFPSGGMYASPSDIEEERRLFYVAMTRAKEKLYLSFARERMRNGKREANSPSRFVKEIDPGFIENPLRSDNFEEGSEGLSFGRFFQGFDGPRGGKGLSGRSSGQGRNGGFSPGRQGAVKYGMPRGSSYCHSSEVRHFPQKPASQESADSFEKRLDAVRNRPLPPKVSDEDFVPVPMTSLKVGDEVEHNRFGFGKILEITGSAPEMRAKILFDAYGEKTLLLKYAKIRFK